MYVPVSGIKTSGKEQHRSYAPRQQAVAGVGKTMEQRYIRKYEPYAKQQIAQPVIYQPAQSAEARYHRLEHRQIETYVIKEIIVQIIYIKQRHAYIRKQDNHRNGLVVEYKHQGG